MARYRHRQFLCWNCFKSPNILDNWHGWERKIGKNYSAIGIVTLFFSPSFIAIEDVQSGFVPSRISPPVPSYVLVRPFRFLYSFLFALAVKVLTLVHISRMRSSLVVRASDCQCTSCNCPGFDPIIRRHSGIWGAADEAVLNIVRRKNLKSPKKYLKKTFAGVQGEVAQVRAGSLLRTHQLQPGQDALLLHCRKVAYLQYWF
jgi:hypothetical protein